MKITSLCLAVLLLPLSARAQSMQPLNYEEAPVEIVEAVDANLDGGERDDLLAVLDENGEVVRYMAEIEAGAGAGGDDENRAVVLDAEGLLLFKGGEADRGEGRLPEAVEAALDKADEEINREVILLERNDTTVFAALVEPGNDDDAEVLRLISVEGETIEEIEVADKREAMTRLILIDLTLLE